MGEFVGMFRRDGGIVDKSVARRFGSSLGRGIEARIWRGAGALRRLSSLSGFAADRRQLPTDRDPRRARHGERRPSRRSAHRSPRCSGPAQVLPAETRRWSPKRVPAGASMPLRGCEEVSPSRCGTRSGGACRWRATNWEAGRFILCRARPPYPVRYRAADVARHAGDAARDGRTGSRPISHARESRPGANALSRHSPGAAGRHRRYSMRDSARIRRYWTIDDIKPVRLRADADYVEAGREMLDRAVASCIARSGKLGATLSGGLDSSGAVATAARLTRRGPLYRVQPGARACPTPMAAWTNGVWPARSRRRYPNVDLVVVDDNRTLPARHRSRDRGSGDGAAAYRQRQYHLVRIGDDRRARRPVSTC